MIIRLKLKSFKEKIRLKNSSRIESAKNSDSPCLFALPNLNLHRAYSNMTPKRAQGTFDSFVFNMAESIKLTSDDTSK